MKYLDVVSIVITITVIAFSRLDANATQINHQSYVNHHVVAIGNSSLLDLSGSRSLFEQTMIGLAATAQIVDPNSNSKSYVQGDALTNLTGSKPNSLRKTRVNVSISEPAKTNDADEQRKRPKRIMLYASNDISSDVITSVNLDKNAESVKIHGGTDNGTTLIQVSVNGGIPVWVKRELTEVSSYGPYIKIHARMANAFSTPSMKSNTKLGILMRGEKFKVIRAEEDWVRVWSPSSSRVWALTKDLESIMDAL